MPNIIKFKLPDKKIEKLDIKRNNEYILYRLFMQGDMKCNPYAYKCKDTNNIFEFNALKFLKRN